MTCGKQQKGTVVSMSKAANAPRALDRREVFVGLAVGLLLFWQQLALHSVTPAVSELLAPFLNDMGGAFGWIAFVAVLTASSWVAHAARRARPKLDESGPARKGCLALGCACMAAGSVLTLWASKRAGAALMGGALCGVGFALGALALLRAPALFSGGSTRPVLLIAVLAQLACTLVLKPLPTGVALGALCALPLLFGPCAALAGAGSRARGRADQKEPTASEGARACTAGVETVASALARREAQRALLICLVVFFFALFYTNVTGPRFNAFADDALLSFNLDVTVAKCLVSALTLALIRADYLHTLPVAIITLFTTSMLVASFAPDADATFLAADSFAAAGRLLAFAYALVTIDALRRARWPHAGGEASAVVGLAGASVLLSVLVGIVVQNYIKLSTEGLTLTTAAVLYVLLIASNVFLRRGEKQPVVVRIEGEGVDEKALAMHRAQALAARFPQLTERETQIVGLILMGLTAPSVANRLSISENTAKTHMRRIYQKLGVHSRQELLGLAYEAAPLKQ